MIYVVYSELTISAAATSWAQLRAQERSKFGQNVAQQQHRHLMKRRHLKRIICFQYFFSSFEKAQSQGQSRKPSAREACKFLSFSL